MAICYMQSPVGRLALEAEGDALWGVRWASTGERARPKLLALEGVVLSE